MFESSSVFAKENIDELFVASNFPNVESFDKLLSDADNEPNLFNK